MPEILKKSDLPDNDLVRRRRADIEKLLPNYPDRRAILVPLLWLIQEEDGWISPQLMVEAAQICRITVAEVKEVVSFYQMLNTEPCGKYVFGICATLPCALSGADGLYADLSERFGIEWEETTEDGMWTIQRRECLGACSEAPVMLVNQTLETKLTREKVERIIAECEKGQRKPYYTGRP